MIGGEKEDDLVPNQPYLTPISLIISGPKCCYFAINEWMPLMVLVYKKLHVVFDIGPHETPPSIW